MHIAIDATWLGGEQGVGLATYAYNLLKTLAFAERDHRYTAYSMRIRPEMLPGANNRLTLKAVPDLLPFMPYLYSWTSWYYSGFPFQIRNGKPDIFLSLSPALPLFCPCPRVVTVHDLTPLKLQGSVRKDFLLLFRSQVSYAVRHAERIIAVSQSTRNDLVDLMGVVPEKIEVIYEGYNKAFQPLVEWTGLESAKNRYGIDKEYIFFAGSLEPKKNLPRVIKAYASLVRENKISHKLVITGKRLKDEEVVFRSVRDYGLEKHVIFTGYVPRRDMPILMGGARLFVFPSLHEGFGIPPLEAMACGVPVITSNISSLPEVAGDAGMLVNPYSVDEIADAINAVLTDSALSERMRQKGLERAKLFSWEKTAAAVIKAIEEVLYCGGSTCQNVRPR